MSKMPNKLTDSEIKKALEEWIKNYEGTYGNFRNLGNALDLINRQEAEIALSQRRIATLEKLAEHRKKAIFERVAKNLEIRKDLETANAENESLKAEVDDLKRELKTEENTSELYHRCIVGQREKLETVKAEAYKECIEKVKEELKNIAKIDWQGGYYYLVGTAFFDNLLNELVVVSEIV